MAGYRAYVGLDVHKDTIATAVAWPGREEPEYRGILPNCRKSLNRLIRNLQGTLGESTELRLRGRTVRLRRLPGNYRYRPRLPSRGADPDSAQARRSGQDGPSRRGDSRTPHRAGELTRVWVPGPDQEGVRDLTRAREDMKAVETKSRLRLGAFLLRHGRVYCGKSRWTQAHCRWLEEQKFALPLQQLVFQEYVDAAIAAGKRTDALVAQMSLRGVSTITAMTVLAELGDLTRFDSPRELMGFVGLVPGEYSSGSRRRQGAITRTGNGHVRRLLTEAAWAYRFPARKTAHLRRKAAKAKTPDPAFVFVGIRRNFDMTGRTRIPAFRIYR